MNKDWLEKNIEEIDVPKAEVYAAIAKGIANGKNEKYQKRKRKIRPGILISAAAASLFLASGFIFSPITNVLAKVPVLGAIYEDFMPSVGKELVAKNLVTSLNQEVTSNGVNVTITSAYFDGNMIGVTFKAQGKDLTIEQMDEGNRPAAGYSYELFDGLDKNQWVSSGTTLKETEDGFIGAIEFYSPDGQIPTNFSLPLVFTHMADVHGNWKFDVPIEQLPAQKIAAVYESNSKDGAYSFKMDTIIKGQATTLIEYNTTMPSLGSKDEIRITVFDNNENRLSKSTTDLISSNERNGRIERSARELFTSKIEEEASYLMVYPEIRQNEEETVGAITNSVPFQIESPRFDYNIKVTKIETTGNELTIDYALQNVDAGEFKEGIIQNFADFIQVIHTDHIERDEHGDLLLNGMLNHMIRSEQVELINQDELHFRSMFVIDAAYEAYSLIVPFGNLSVNQPIKMDSIKVELKN